jgi:hypothetical protein
MQQPSREEAARILAVHPDSQAFYFYDSVGSPTKGSAHSLEEFIDSIKTVDSTSIEFHCQRGDFENWIKMLGDEILSKQIANIQKSELKGNHLRKRLSQVLHLRYGVLKKISQNPVI